MYTKGEWTVDPDYDWVRSEDGRVVANCTGYDRDEQRANAHLIAAAPAMYEALKAVDKYFTTGFPDNMRRKRIAVEMLDEALAKAEGK